MFPERPLHRLNSEERRVVKSAIRDRLAGESAVVFAYLFGSFPEGEPFHDIDVGIFVRDSSPDEAPRLAFEIAARLEPAIRFPVDVIALNGRTVAFRFHAYRGELLVARDEDLLTQELERTMALYFDIEPVLRAATREAFT